MRTEIINGLVLAVEWGNPLLIGFGLVVGGFIFMCIIMCMRKIQPGKAGIRIGFGGPKVSLNYILRVPLLQSFEVMDISVKKLEIHRKGNDGLVCKDNIRADISVAFYISVDADEASVMKVAKMLGVERASDMVQLRELFEAKFSEALKTAGKQMEFHELFIERIKFRDKIQTTIGEDLGGFKLQDVAIDYLEQTPRASGRSLGSPSANAWRRTNSPSAPRCRWKRKMPTPTSPRPRIKR